MNSSAIVTLEILRSQILEIHASLQDTLLRQIVRKTPAKFRRDETIKTQTRISVTCIDSSSQQLVIEELSRLYALAESLKSSLDVLTRANGPSQSMSLPEDE